MVREHEDLFKSGLGELFLELESLCISSDVPIRDGMGTPVLFRLLHSIKSMAGLGAYDELEHAAHDLESSLAQGGAENLILRLAGLVDRWKHDAWTVSVSKDESPASSEVSECFVAFGTWELDASKTEKIWNQLNRKSDVWCLSAWVISPGESALTRARLLLAKLEDSMWVIDSRIWNPDKPAGGPGALAGELAVAGLDQGEQLFFQALVAVPYSLKPDFYTLLPDQVFFWTLKEVDPDFIKGRSEAKGAGLLLYARDLYAQMSVAPGVRPCSAPRLDALFRRACLDAAAGEDGFSNDVYNLAKKVFSPKGSSIRLYVSVDRVDIPLRTRTLVLEVLVHLLRNVLAHAVETAEVRQGLYKPPETSVCIHIQRSGDFMDVLLWDDGAGIDFPEDESTYEALFTGNDPEKNTSTVHHYARDWSNDIFSVLEAQSTEVSAHAGLVSGRGIGIPGTAFIVQNLLQGDIHCYSRSGQGSCFSVRIPAVLLQMECALFRWYESYVAIPLSLLMCVGQEPLRVDIQGSDNQISWAGRNCSILNPVPLLDLEQMNATAILDCYGSNARWVGAYLGNMTAVFPRDANTVYSVLVSDWVELTEI